MTDENTPTPGPAQHRSRAKLLTLTLLGGATVAIAFAVMVSSSPGSGVELANNIPSSSTGSSPQPSAGPSGTQSKAAASMGASPAATTAAVPPSAGPVIPPSAINNPKIALPVKSAVAGFITKAGQISTAKLATPTPGSPRPTPAAIDFTAVAFGAALGELEAQNQEFSSNGWQQTGTVVVVGTATTSTQKRTGTPQVDVQVCLDSSAVQIVDDTGATVLKAEKPGTRRNLNIYAVQEVSGEWLVVNHTFPDDTHC